MIARSNFGQYKSGWEISVANSLHKAKIPFYYESPKFQVNDFFYTPDFFLSNLRIDGKNVILEPHGLMQEKDLHKFELFRRNYGADFFLILLTRNDVIPFVSEEAYDFIWPIEYSDLLMERIRSGHL